MITLNVLPSGLCPILFIFTVAPVILDRKHRWLIPPVSNGMSSGLNYCEDVRGRSGAPCRPPLVDPSQDFLCPPNRIGDGAHGCRNPRAAFILRQLPGCQNARCDQQKNRWRGRFRCTDSVALQQRCPLPMTERSRAYDAAPRWPKRALVTCETPEPTLIPSGQTNLANRLPYTWMTAGRTIRLRSPSRSAKQKAQGKKSKHPNRPPTRPPRLSFAACVGFPPRLLFCRESINRSSSAISSGLLCVS
jgi:hypothetical protein